MTGRPRRTRIYGANYNIGESYYKPTLDNLNRKQFGGSKDDSGGIGGIDRLRRELSSEITLPTPVSTFKKALTEEPPLYDFRGRKASLFDEDLDEDVQATLRKIRELKKGNSNFLDDTNSSFEDSKKKRGLEVGRILKSFYDTDENEGSGLSILRLNKNASMGESFQSTSTATLRANATKERLANIESEMSERYEKQVQREKRSANLKKLLSEADTENTKSVKKVTF